MKRIFYALLFLACSTANAQFVTGQILTAAQLNAAFANVLATSGGTLTGPLTVQGSTTVANLTVNGAFTVPGGFSPGSLSPQAANSLIGNASGTTQAPGVVAVPSCSASGNALKWTSASGFTCGTGNALTANPLSQFAATTSAQLAGIISDETGSGSAVFGTSPTLTTPAISGGTITNAPVSGSTGSFTTLAASSTVSGAGFTTLLSPYLTTASAASTYAPLASPALTGTPTAPTATAGTNTTQLATLAFANTAATNAAAAVTPAVMTSYTPAVTASTGTFTTVSATGHYYVVGKLVFFEMTITITTVGTASGTVLATLPLATNSSGGGVTFAGQETSLTGKTLQGLTAAGVTSTAIRYYDVSSPIAAGATLVLSGSYVSN